MTEAQKRSTFVTVVAWIFIVLAGIGTLITALQNVMLLVIVNTGEMEAALQAAPPDMPPAFAWMFRYFHLFFVAYFLMAAATLTAAIGLLLRRNWARRMFIAMMVLGIVWNIGGLVLQMVMLSSMRAEFGTMPPDAPDMQVVFTVFMVFGAGLVLAICGVFGWIARRLMSPAIVAEFADPGVALRPRS
ncbi:hypothetical protein [Coralloluteibacterium thermophilus]|uniref:Uncharacterized protein n=1 Tax=Coralloluteibacterium thermophilum TaxID=2707049 RepID=A0ABV9NKI4_9GAMM